MSVGHEKKTQVDEVVSGLKHLLAAEIDITPFAIKDDQKLQQLANSA